ncbi:MAG: glycosyltransferase family 4 protein [Bacteroidales bacterium]|nr:glycosyltransferase family 4 protein [Bacteroidales bacterium]
MKIAVNTRLLLKNRLEGIGIFTRETLSRITKAHPEHQFYFLFDRAYDESFIFSDNVTPVVAHPQARHPYLWYLFFEHGIPLKLRKIKPDLFLSTDGWIPTRLDIPTVNVIHDLNFLHHPEFVPPVVRRYYDRFFPKFARNATRLATVSQFSCDDIHQSYQVPTERIDVVYNGANQAYRPYTEEEQSAVKQHYTDKKDYFLFVGLIHKRKNLANIFRAFELFKERTGSPMKLVVVGDKKWWAGEIEDTYLAMHYREDVVMLGRQQIDTLSALTAAATAMVYASLFEGFGQPIVDAFNAHTAVITSDVSSMPEIAGGAALLVNPYSVEEIAHAMEQLCLDENLRNTLIEKGIARKGIYTWDHTAELLWQTVEKCLP